LAGLAVILVATLTPTSDVHGVAASTSLLCLVCGDEGGADVINNLLLFLPLAIGLRLSGVSWRRTVAAGFLLSLTVELLQLRVVAGRDASLSDLLTNTTSSAIGATIGSLLPRAVTPSPRRALALLAGGLVAVLALLGVWAWLLMPLTPAGPIRSTWAHETPATDVFDGRVRWIRIDGVPMPKDAPLPDSAALRRRLDLGTMILDAGVVSGAPVRDRLWIYLLRASHGGVVTLTQLRRRAGVQVPTRALRFRFGAPIVTLGDAFPDSAGVPVYLQATEAAGRITLTSSYDGHRRSVELGLSPAFGWVLFAPFELGAGTGVRWFTALVVALLLLPLGYWAAWTRRPVLAAAVLATGLVIVLAAVPSAAGLPPVHWSEWLAGTLSAAAGWALQRPAAYLQGRCASPSGRESSSS
jgi:hypothetical protein